VRSLTEPASDLTWDEFLALPYETRNASLIDGEIITCPPDAQHELILANLSVAFMAWLRADNGRGESCTQQPVRIDDRRGYQSDFAWYPPQRCDLHPEGGWFIGPPELIVEVDSATGRPLDWLLKRSDYERIGIGEVWFVDSRPQAEPVIVCRRESPGERFVEVDVGIDDVLTSPLLDGFELQVARLFER
jgi:Uma2 family endonuclease